jgi:hypothetical protein
MRLLAQALQLCFWALPVQRLCTVAGLTLMAVTGLWFAPSGLSGRVLEWAILGYMITVLPLLALGGPLWRAFSAQRAVALAPHGRAKLLVTALLVAALISLALATFHWLLYLWLPPQWRMDLNGWWQLVANTFVLATWWSIASFFAARSSLAMFTVLLILLGGGYAAVLLDIPLPGELAPGRAVGVMLLGWGVFGAWYLRARRIRPSAWSSRRAEDEALVTRADVGGIGAQIPRAAALQRLLLGGRSLGRIILQWLLALGALQAMLLAIRAWVDASEAQVVPLQLAALLLVLPAMAALSWLVAARLRPLWLASGCSRAGLFAAGESTLLVLAAGLAAVCLAAFLALWRALPVHSEASLAFGLCALLGPLLLPVYAALLHGRGAAFTASTMIVTVVPAFFAARAYLRILVDVAASDQWWWLAPLPVATVALRLLARRRWLSGDMPRAATAPAS